MAHFLVSSIPKLAVGLGQELSALLTRTVHPKVKGSAKPSYLKYEREEEMKEPEPLRVFLPLGEDRLAHGMTIS